jgi:GAF domain-containing protein/DNA-binding CsgD family transcriptional regulator
MAIVGKRSSGPYAQEERRSFEALTSQGTMALRRVKLKTRAWHDANQFAFLRNISAAISGTPSLSRLLNSALEQMIGLTRMQGGAVLLLDDEQRWLTLAANRSLPEAARDLIEQNPIRVGEFVPGIAAERGEIVVIENVQDDQRELPVLREAGIMTHVCIPLPVRGQPLGVLGLIDRLPRYFSARELALLTAAGEEIGAAIDGTRLYAHLMLRVKRNRALADLMDVATSRLDVTKVFDPVARQAKKLIDFDGLSVAVSLPSEGCYEVMMLHSPTSVPNPPLGERVPVKGGPPGEAIITGCPILRKNLPHDASYPRERWLAKQLGIRSALHVPLRSLGRVIGVLVFVSQKRAAYGDPELEVAQEISNRFGIVVDHTLRRRSGNQTDDELTQSFVNVIRELARDRSGQGYHRGRVLAERMAAKLAAYLPGEGSAQASGADAKTHALEGYFDRGLPNGLQETHSRETLRSGSPNESIRQPQYADSHTLIEELTSREREVLGLVARGFRNKEIAHQLGLAESTVKYHVTHILEKLGVSSRTEAVTKALQLGIMALP